MIWAPKRRAISPSNGLGFAAAVCSRKTQCARGLGFGALVLLFGCTTAPRHLPTPAKPELSVERSDSAALSAVPCAPTGLELCFNAIDDNCNGLFDEGCGIPNAEAQFLLAWAAPEADLDLQVADPAGNWVKLGHRTPLGLTKDQECPSNRNPCHGQNYENVYWAADDAAPLPEGKYQVRVRLEHQANQALPLEAVLSVRLSRRVESYKLLFTETGAEQQLVFEVKKRVR